MLDGRRGGASGFGAKLIGGVQDVFATQGGVDGLLAIVRDIVQAHGGRVHLESAPGTGTRFTLELPCEAVRS